MLRRFGDKLRYLRRRHRMTQSHLAQTLTSVTQGHISLLETSRRVPSRDVVIEVATVFRISFDYLLRDHIPPEDAEDYHSVPAPQPPERPRLFGTKLRHLRQLQQLTQAELAQRLPAWTQSQISSLEIDRSDPSLDLVIALADIFGVTIDYLLRDTQPVALIQQPPGSSGT